MTPDVRLGIAIGIGIGIAVPLVLLAIRWMWMLPHARSGSARRAVKATSSAMPGLVRAAMGEGRHRR